MKRVLSKVHTMLSAYRALSRVKDLKVVPSFIDYIKLHKATKLSKEEYINFRFDKCSKEFRDSFLPYQKAEQYWEILNPKKNAILARDKFVGHSLFELLNIPTSSLYFAYNEEADGDDNAMVLHKPSEVVCKLKTLGVNKFVVKPAADSAHGQGVGVYSISEFVEFGNKEGKSIEDILVGGMLLFESFVEQTEQISQFNPSSVNTIRMMTALYPNNEVKLFAAFIKIGRAGSCVDNAGSGGNVDCAINLETGELYNALQFNSWKDVRKIERHPDSGTQLNGQKINNWNSIKNGVMAMQGQIPYLKTIGWDVAVSKNGPVIIEINNWWDSTGQLFLGKGWHKEVKSCYDAWVKYYNHKKQ